MPLYFVFALNVFSTASNFANRILLALFAVRLGASPVMVGVLGAMFAFFPSVMAVMAGRLCDRFGSRYLMMFGTLGTALGMTLPFFWPTLPTVLIAALMCGFSQVFFNVCTQNLTGQLSTPADRPRNFANYALTNSAGQFMGPLIGGFSIDHLSNANASMLLAVFAAIPLFMLCYKREPLEPPGVIGRERKKKEVAAHDDNAAGGAWAMLKNPAVRRTLYTGSLLNSGLNLYQFYMPVYAHSVGISASIIGVVMAMHSTAAFFVRAVLPRLIQRWKEDRVLMMAFICGATGLLLVPFFQSPWVLGLLSFIFGMGMGVGQPIVTMQMFMNSAEGRSGEGIGLKMMTNQFTKMVSPIAFGAVASAFGLFPMFWLNAILLGTGGFLSRPRKKPEAAQA